MLAEWYRKLRAFLTRIKLLPLGISTILLIVNLMVLALPLGGIVFFRLYENQLVRETEAELIAQSAFVAEIYKREIQNQSSGQGGLEDFGLGLEKSRPKSVYKYYTPQKTELDLATDTMLPPRPDGVVPDVAADDISQRAGRVMDPMLHSAQKTTLAGMRVLDQNGIVVSGGGETGLSFAHIPEVRTAMTGHYASVIRERVSDNPVPNLRTISRGTGIRIFTAYPIVVGDRLWGVAYLSRTPESVLKYMYDDRAKLILAVVSVVLLTLLIALLTSWTIARPIYRLVDRTRSIAAGDRSTLSQPDIGGTKEIALLSDSFTNMATALEARSDYIKQFATHVSHEFKTPLASIRGAAELLAEHMSDMSEAERQRFIHNIVSDAERMKRLVSQLLQLARADDPASTVGRTELVKFFTELCTAESQDHIELNLEKMVVAPVWIAMSEEALHMIVSNLIKNAQQHQATQVRIGLRQEGRVVKISICDNGEGISPANREKIFEPFFTTRRDEGGTGLGLGIVQSILQNHDGSIRLESTSGATCFVISLPILERPSESRTAGV